MRKTLFWHKWQVSLSISLKILQYIKQASFSRILLILIRKTPVCVQFVAKNIIWLKWHFFVYFCKNASKLRKPKGSYINGSIWWGKYFFDIHDKFFVNFCKNASKQQKSYVGLFDEKNTFLTYVTIFLSISVKMLQNSRKA